MSDDEHCWDMLGALRQVLEENLPPGWVPPADMVEPRLESEVQALRVAIRRLTSALPSNCWEKPPPVLTDEP